MLDLDESRTLARMVAGVWPRIRAPTRIINVVDLAVMLYLAGGPASIDDLVTALSISVATASATVAGLESAGYAGRSKDPDDGRRTISRLTAKGARLLASGTNPPRLSFDRPIDTAATPPGPLPRDVCGKGHPLTPENTIERRGRRECRECKNARRRVSRST